MTTILGPQASYCELIDHEIMKKVEAESKEKRYPLRPSSGGFCARRLAFDLMEYRGFASYEKTLMEPNVHRLLSLGHSVEYSALKHMDLLEGFKLRYKQQVVSLFKLDPTEGDPGRMIEGSLDVVLWSEQYKCVLDVKSAGDGWSVAYKSRWEETMDKFEKMSTLVKIGENGWYADDLEAFIGELNGDFLVDNLVQLNLYACSEFLRERGIDHAVIYKYNKNSSKHYEIRFKPSLTLFNKIKDKFNDINKAVEARDPESIKCESFLGSMRCAFCPYKGQCWGTQDASKAWFKTMPKKEWPKEVREHPALALLMMQYERGVETQTHTDKTETLVLKYMTENKIKKIRLDNGNVYELKYLKTPNEHFELRRSKA